MSREDDLKLEEVEKLISEGFKPFIRTVGEYKYVALRKFDKTLGKYSAIRNVGPYSDELWRQVTEIYERVKSGGGEADREEGVAEEIQPTVGEAEFLPLTEAARKLAVSPVELMRMVKEGGLKEGVDFKREEAEGGGEKYFVNVKSVERALRNRISGLLDSDIRRELIELKGSIMNEVRMMLSEFEKRVGEHIEKRLTEGFSTESGLKLSIPESIMPSIRIRLSPTVIFYYGYISSLWKQKTGRNMSLEEFINGVLEEHLEDCLGLYTALGREVVLTTKG